MKKKKKKGKKKPSRLRKFLYPVSLIAVVGVCAYVLVPGFRELESVRSRKAELEGVQQEKKSANQALKREIARMNTSEGIEEAARKYLQLAKPDEVVVSFESPEEGKPTEK